MPTYAYACTACDNRFEVQQSFTDDALTQCPRCEGRLRKLFSSVGIVFKGSGFYRTDSRDGSKAKAADGASGDGAASGGSGGSGGSGTESSGSTPAARKDPAAPSTAGASSGSSSRSGSSSGSSSSGSSGTPAKAAGSAAG